MVDAITTQVVRNRIGSLMQEMHYHFYRSGYSTIIRESRDFSCVILDRHGGLIVAPPMFFHAPVYRHLVAKIFALHGDDIGDGDMFVCNHPYDGGLPHVSDMAFVSPIMSGATLVGLPDRSRTRPMSAAPIPVRPRPMPRKSTKKACCCRR